MKCFKVSTNEVENSVVIDGVIFSPQQCTAEEETIVLKEMENEWYIHSDYETTTEYCELSSSSSGSVMVYELQTEDAVIYNNQVIGFVIIGYLYDSEIRGKYFSIQNHENFNYRFESHRSYDHGDGDVDTTSYCSLRKKSPRSVLVKDYCIQYEEAEKIYYKRITHDIVREDETGVSVNVDIGMWINYKDVGKKIKVEGVMSKTDCFATLVKKSDLIEVNKLIDEYCICQESKWHGTIEYREISHDRFRKRGTNIEISLNWAGALQFSEIGKQVHVGGGDYATLVKKSELSEYNILMDEYCIRWEKDGTIEYEEISYGYLFKKEGSIGVKVGSWVIEVLFLCESGKEVYVERKKARATLVKKSDLVELNKLINEYCICWEKDGEVRHEDISYGRFIEEPTGLKVKIGNWKRLRFDELGTKISVTTNKTASLARKCES